MRHYFLGMAANYGGSEWARHTFTWGRKRDCNLLRRYLSNHYKGEAILCKNGRSALALALKAYFEPGDMILINGFTCYAVYEAVRAAKLVPVFVDVTKRDLNFDIDALEDVLSTGDRTWGSPMGHSRDMEEDARTGPVDSALSSHDGRERSGPRKDWSCVRGIIIQNTFGNPTDIKSIERFAKKHNLTIVEDLAHSAGIKYKDGREAGTVGAAAVWSWGKDKSIDTISGGAVVLRDPCKHEIKAPSKAPRPSDHLRARFYPTFGAICRGLSYLRLGGIVMRGLVKIHWVERSADSKLDFERRPSKFEAKLALEQMKRFRRNGEPPIRDFCYVHNRAEVLKKLQKKGYYFAGFWYEKPISPERYYKKVHFPEDECPNAIWAAEHIINLPNYYTRRDLTLAQKIIKEYLEESEDE